MAEYEEKFLVFNKADLKKYLSGDEAYTLECIQRTVERKRLDDGKPLNDYLVCNQDEPYASEVLDIILSGEDKKQK